MIRITSFKKILSAAFLLTVGFGLLGSNLTAVDTQAQAVNCTNQAFCSGNYGAACPIRPGNGENPATRTDICDGAGNALAGVGNNPFASNPPAPGTPVTPGTGVGAVVGGAVLSGLNLLGTTCIWPGQDTNGDGVSDCTSANSLANMIWNFLVQFATVIASMALVVAGYLFMTGNETGGRSLLRNAIFGLIVILSAGTVVDVITKMFTTTPGQISINPVIIFVQALVNGLILPAASVVSVVFFVIGAYNLMMAGGNGKMVADGWAYIKNAITGLIVVLLAFTIVQLVVGVINGFF